MPFRAAHRNPARRRVLPGLAAAVTVAAALAGCGSSSADPGAAVNPLRASASSSTPRTCQQTALDVLGHVLLRVYKEGVFSERTASARALITHSLPLREAVENDDPRAALAAGKALIATGHMTNLVIVRDGHTLVKLGGTAMTPLRGALPDASGHEIGTYLTSVWSDDGFVSEGDGITQGAVVLRAGGKTVAGSFPLPDEALAPEGTVMKGGASYQYTSFDAANYPSGGLRVYLLRSAASIEPLCGATSEDTVTATLSRIATLIYQAEGGPRTLTQIHRVQHSQAMLEAVAKRDPVATRAAIFTLLNHHIVRLRVKDAKGALIQDVGGPFVLQPVSAPLRLHGKVIGSFTLSIQDDEGYLRLTGRLAGLKVLMFMGTRLVKNSLGPNPGTVPASGPYSYHGENFQIFTVHGTAFPSGPLTIRVLIPIPYV